MPIHLFEGNRAEQRLCPMRQLDDPDLADSSLNLYLSNAEDSVIMSATVGGTHAKVAEFLEP